MFPPFRLPRKKQSSSVLVPSAPMMVPTTLPTTACPALVLGSGLAPAIESLAYSESLSRVAPRATSTRNWYTPLLLWPFTRTKYVPLVSIA